MNLPKFKTNWDWYLKYIGLGLVAAGLIAYDKPFTRYVIGIGLLILGMVFMKKKVN
jgi:hypothetical protein